MSDGSTVHSPANFNIFLLNDTYEVSGADRFGTKLDTGLRRQHHKRIEFLYKAHI